MRHWVLSCIAVLLMLGWNTASAQTCTISAGPLSSAPYNPFSLTNNDSQGSFSFSCTRAPGNNGTNFPSTFWVGVDTGSFASRLRSGTSDFLNRSLFQNYTGCNTAWGGAIGMSFANGNTGNGDQSTGPFPGTYCFRIGAGQTSAVPSPPTYNDTVTISVRSTNSSGFLWGQTTFGLSTSVNAVCEISTINDLAFAYTSFGGAATATGGGFTVRCTNTLPFKVGFTNVASPATTKSVSASANSLGLAYNLGLDLSAGLTGTGVVKNYSVTGTMVGGQAGTCTTATCNSTAEKHTIYLVY